MLEAFGLSWLAGLLSGVLSDALKDRLEPATSGEKARDRAFALFEGLRAVDRTTDAFVGALVLYASLVEAGLPPGAAQLSEISSPTTISLDPADREKAAEERADEIRLFARSEADVAVVRAQAAL